MFPNKHKNKVNHVNGLLSSDDKNLGYRKLSLPENVHPLERDDHHTAIPNR